MTIAHVTHASSKLSNTSNTVSKYLRSIQTMNKSTAKEYYIRLNSFETFLLKDLKKSTDHIIEDIKLGSLDVYDILSGYSVYLQNNSDISAITLKQRIITAKNFLEYHDVDVSPRKFKFKIKLPRVIRRNKDALNKEDIINILNACSDIRLKTYVMLLAAGGFRAVEALSIRICDIHFDASPVKVSIRGEYTKTKSDRFVYLTNEIVGQLKLWLEYKYRTRRVCHLDRENGNTITDYRTPDRKDDDLVFAVYQNTKTPNPSCIYNDFRSSFAKTLDRIGMGDKEDNERRRKLTLHSLRRYVKTTISDLGYGDFSEFMIGHSGSTYWRKKPSDVAELFSKVEPYLTFLDYPELEARGADIQTKLTEKENEIQSLRQRDQIKDQELQSMKEHIQAIEQSQRQSFEEFKVENHRIIKEAMTKFKATLSPKALERFIRKPIIEVLEE
ncbi:MAG: tyrosine-type recombinase/integrase [Candidatus Nitrosopolaris sp.]